MDTNFTFPRQQAAVARPRPPKTVESGSSTRESNVLRASVLDAALELGLGTNPIVAGWMFDNALPEEDEEEDTIVSPGLTYTTSEESSNFALSPSSSAYSSGSSSSKFPPYSAGARTLNDKLFDKEPNITIVEPSPMNLSFEQSISGMGVPGGGISFPDIAPPPRPTTPNSSGKKLKKKKKDGYESDGGYMSESGKKKEKAKKKDVGAAGNPDESAFVETEKEAKKRAKQEKKEQELERKRTKSLMSAAAKAAKKAEVKEAGYDTDGGAIKQSKSSKKSKSSAPPSTFNGDASVGYETDGYQSATPKKSKTRFFKLSTKSSKADLRAGAPNVPPLPSAPPQLAPALMPLPIAERFATTFGPLTLSGLSEDNDSSTPDPGLASSSIVSPLTASTPTSATPVPLLKSSLAFPSVNTRDSQASMTSSSSNGSRSQQPYSPLSASLSPGDGAVESVGTSVGSSSAHHGHGSGSYSTITSASHQQQPFNLSTDIIPSVSNDSATHPSYHSAKFGSMESNTGSLRPPALSFPAIRTPSPSRRPPPVPPPTTSPPIAPLRLLKNLRSKASLDNLHLPSMSRARSPSPMPVTPVSPGSPGTPDTPFVIAPAPSNSTASSPTLGMISPVQTTYLQAPSSSQSSLPVSPISPRSPARSFHGDGSTSPVPPATREALLPPPRTVISPPNTAVLPHQRPVNLSINPNIAAKPSSLSPGPNPNVLAYYDLPPPSPPPAGPLPSVPSQPSPSPLSPPSSSANILPSPGALRQRVIDRTPRQLPPEFSAVFSGQTNIERGRQSPFPARPVPASAAPTSGVEPGTVQPLRRYRDLYSPTSANTLMPPMAQYEIESAQPMSQVKRARFRSKNSWIEDSYTKGGSGDYEDEEQYADEDEDEDRVDLADVLERYDDRSLGQVGASSLAQAEQSSPSIATDQQDDRAVDEEAYTVRPRPPRTRDEPLEVTSEFNKYRDSEYQFDDGRTIGDRTSRWSGSIYSRASIMDEDSSGQTRDRLVRRVEAMLRDGGSGNKDFIPPVPRIPDAYSSSALDSNRSVTPGRSWNRF